MATAPDPKRPRPPQQEGTSNQAKPLVTVTAGSPDHKILLRALRWLKEQAAEQLDIPPQPKQPAKG
ncbi:MAG TPA: hypothetical protein VD973_09570 [Symbiobacteriaceae bacterium]|nr:hypothetical protein [Symbiobacteriaceae bacterium]